MSDGGEWVDPYDECPECGKDAEGMWWHGGHPRHWYCKHCETDFSVMNGSWCKVPKGGKLEDWPEMQTYMKNVLAEMFGGEAV